MGKKASRRDPRPASDPLAGKSPAEVKAELDSARLADERKKSLADCDAARKAYKRHKATSIAARAKLVPGASAELQQAAREARAAAVDAKTWLRRVLEATR